MTHPDLETLLRLGNGSSDEESRRHVNTCSDCRTDLATIIRTRSAGATLAADPGLGRLVPPPRGVWEGIQRELGESVEPAPVVAIRAPSRSATSRHTWRLVAASVAGGAVLGASVVAWAGRGGDAEPSQQAARTSSLAPLRGHATRGTLAMTDSPSGEWLSVDLERAQPGPGFLEVWLLDAKTGGMVSLGVLDGVRGLYAVPGGLDLTAYDQVDVSREPYDGNPAHSKVSLARGRVPLRHANG